LLADLKNEGFPSKRPSLVGRSSRAVVRFLIAFRIGVAATLAWQSYGDATREMIASSSPQLGWLAPPVAPVAQAGQDQMKQDITKLQAAEQNILRKIASAPPPRPAAAPARKPAPLTPRHRQSTGTPNNMMRDESGRKSTATQTIDLRESS
jgi:hypothetical protein